MGADVENAATKMEQRINQKAPALRILAHGSSIHVERMKGLIVDGGLPKRHEFGTAIAAT
jgi:hypothetical protein